MVMHVFVCSGMLHGAEKRDSYEVKLPWKLSATGGLCTQYQWVCFKVILDQ